MDLKLVFILTALICTHVCGDDDRVGFKDSEYEHNEHNKHGNMEMNKENENSGDYGNMHGGNDVHAGSKEKNNNGQKSDTGHGGYEVYEYQSEEDDTHDNGGNDCDGHANGGYDYGNHGSDGNVGYEDGGEGGHTSGANGGHGGSSYSNTHFSSHGGKYDNNDYNSYPKYNFAYGVDDSKTGDKHTQNEERDGDKVKGFYILKEADGTTRTVRYTADKKTGFNAQVERSGQASHPVDYGHSNVGNDGRHE